MKKIILSIATVLIIGLSAFANKVGDVNQQAVKAFTKEFANARNPIWEEKKDYTKVTFTLNEQVMSAFYNNNGELQAVVRNIISDQLPINLLTELKREYNGFWITELFEMASDDQTTYYITLENADKTIVLRSSGTKYWSMYSKANKDAE